MPPPKDFNLEVVKSGVYLPPEHPTKLKPDIYKDIDFFKKIDDHAIQESKKDYANFRDLIWNLCYSVKFDELQRARVIFRWLTLRNLQTIKFADAKPNSPELLLTLFRDGKATYARLYECMARHAGLPCVTISGWAKGVDYHPGVNLLASPPNHSWNAVRIDGQWQLVDCHWATRFLKSEHNSPDNLVYEYDDFYFIPDPSELVHTHYAEDPAYLLLPPERPISKEQFEDWPLLKSFFFTNEMYLLEQCARGVIHAKYGIAVVSTGLTKPTAYTYKLMYGEQMKETMDDKPLANYVLQETLEKQIVHHLRLPQKGDYYLIVFADVSDGPQTSNDSGEHVFKAISEFKIVCDSPAKGEASFPTCSDVVWGLDQATANRFNLSTPLTGGLILSPNGHIEARFRKKGDTRIYPRLVGGGVDPKELKKTLLLRNEGDMYIIASNLPKEGEYGLEIFANDPKKDGDMFTHVAQYLVSYTPSTHKGSVGEEAIDPLTYVDLYGVVPDSKIDEVVQRSSLRGLKEQPNLVKVRTNKALGDIHDQPHPDDIVVQQTTYDKVPLMKVEPTKEYQRDPKDTERYTAEVSIKAPDNFTISEIKTEEVAPKADAFSLVKMFIDPKKVFNKVDEHAVEVSVTEHKNFKDIMYHLIYARNITDDLDKARAIFLWLCSKDLSKLDFPNAQPGTPEEMLLKLKKGDTTYARVYETLCSYAGLHCKTITGFAKGAEYRPGMKFTPDQNKGQHSWNAVFVKGTWQLVDCHWAARRLVGDKNAANEDNIRFELDEYYFMPAPSQLIFSHFPDDASWQLLARQLSLEEFENLVPVKPTFFKYGLLLYSHAEAVVNCGDKCAIRIDCPKDKTDLIKFTFGLKYEDGKDKFKDVPLNRYAMLETVKGACYVTVRAPEKGEYLLVVYAKNLEQQTKEGVYGGICEYKIISSSGTDNPFPPCVHSAWGPGDSADKFPITPLQSRATVHANDEGIAEIKFKMPTKLRFMAKLKSNTGDEKDLAQYVLHRVVGDQAIFKVVPPRAGEYGLEIYANDPATGGQNLQHAYQYLIQCKKAATIIQPFPTLPSGYLGPQSNFEKLGMKTASFEDPYIENSSGELQVGFNTTQPLRTSAQLIYVSNNENKDYSAYVLQQSLPDNITFMLKLPEPGLYKFQLFAMPQAEAGDSLLGVYNYLINCKSTVATRIPFPKQYGPWKEGGYLHEPLEGHIDRNRPTKGSASSHNHVYFKLKVPNATTIAVIVGDDWTQLTNEGALWEGEADLTAQWENERKILVCANFGDGDGTNYGTLLEYTM